jgi:hypothetical protein
MGAVGRKRPRSSPYVERRGMEKGQGSACPAAVRRSVLGCRETPGTLVSRKEPKTPELREQLLQKRRRPRDESRVVSREHTRCGYTQFR